MIYGNERNTYDDLTRLIKGKEADTSKHTRADFKCIFIREDDVGKELIEPNKAKKAINQILKVKKYVILLWLKILGIYVVFIY